MTARPLPPPPVMPRPFVRATLPGLGAVKPRAGMPFGSTLGTPRLRVHVLALPGGAELHSLTQEMPDGTSVNVPLKALPAWEREELTRALEWHRENGGAL